MTLRPAALLLLVAGLLLACERAPVVNSDVDPVTRDQLQVVMEAAAEAGSAAPFEELLARHPESPTLQRALQDHLRATLPAEALRAKYTAWTQAEPDNALAWYLYGRAMVDDAPVAEEAFRRAAELDPRNPWPIIGLAYLHTSKGDLFGTIEVYKEALDDAPASALLHLFLGNQYLDLGLYIKAQRELETARRLDPENPEVWASLGKVFAQLSRPEQALELLEAARAADPRIAHIYPTLASLYLGKKDPSAADKAYREGLEYGLERDPELASQIRAAKLVADTE